MHAVPGALAVYVRAGWVLGTGIPGYYREGYTGVLPTHPPREEVNEECPAGAACCAGQGVLTGGNACYGDGGGTGPGTTLRARSVHLRWPSLYQDPRRCRLTANKGEISVNLV